MLCLGREGKYPNLRRQPPRDSSKNVEELGQRKWACLGMSGQLGCYGVLSTRGPNLLGPDEPFTLFGELV